MSARKQGERRVRVQVPSGNTTRLMLEEVARHWKKRGGYSMVGLFGDVSYARGYVSQWDRCAALLMHTYWVCSAFKSYRTVADVSIPKRQVQLCA
jgi:hypothetical protein